MFDDLIVELDPPEKRRGYCEGGEERHLTEAAVMLAYGMHLFRTVPESRTVELHPDGDSSDERIYGASHVRGRRQPEPLPQETYRLCQLK